jgi:hypothetical protein
MIKIDIERIIIYRFNGKDLVTLRVKGFPYSYPSCLKEDEKDPGLKLEFNTPPNKGEEYVKNNFGVEPDEIHDYSKIS